MYIAVGQLPENGEGDGHVWCIDPTRRGDISPEIVVTHSSPQQIVEHRRFQACDVRGGEVAIPNPNSGAIWHASRQDANGDGKVTFEEEIHRSLSRIVIQDGLAFLTDYSGLIHCLDADTGEQLWAHDLLAAATASPTLSATHVIVGSEDGAVTTFALSGDGDVAMPSGGPVSVSHVTSAVYATATIADGVLYVVSQQELFAIANPK